MNGFQTGHGDVFLISLKAGGFGLNLTAADYVLHLDPWKTRPVTIYRLVTVGSVAQKVRWHCMPRSGIWQRTFLVLPAPQPRSMRPH